MLRQNGFFFYYFALIFHTKNRAFLSSIKPMILSQWNTFLHRKLIKIPFDTFWVRNCILAEKIEFALRMLRLKPISGAKVCCTIFRSFLSCFKCITMAKIMRYSQKSELPIVANKSLLIDSAKLKTQKKNVMIDLAE